MKALIEFPRVSTIATLVAGLMLAGCGSLQRGPDDTQRAVTDVNYAASAWIKQGDYHRSVRGLEEALNEYQGDSFEQSTLTVLALVHLEHGNRDAFLETAERLEGTVGRREYISQQTQHVLTVAAAMKGQSRAQLPGRGYETSHGRAVYSLLEVSE